MRVALAFTFMSLALVVGMACGEELPSATNDVDAAVVTPDAGSNEVDASPAVDGGPDAVAVAFCDRSTGFFACEDFEQGAAPARGFTAALAPPLAASDRSGAGLAARIAVTGEAGAPSPALVAMPPVANATTFHSELVAKIDPGAVGDLTIAKLTVNDVNGKKLEVLLTVSPGSSATISFCHPLDGGSTCVGRPIVESFTDWTPIVIEATPTTGHYAVNVSGIEYVDDTNAIGALASARAEVGAVVVWPGGGARVLWLDDALVSTK